MHNQIYKKTVIKRKTLKGWYASVLAFAWEHN
jgi:hypothetical protein